MTNRKMKRILDEMKEPELCEANKLLLKRMESNPDEFHLRKGGKWADYLNMLHSRIKEQDDNILVMLPEKEVLFVWEKYCEVAKNNLHKAFMQRILTPPSDEVEAA